MKYSFFIFVFTVLSIKGMHYTAKDIEKSPSLTYLIKNNVLPHAFFDAINNLLPQDYYTPLVETEKSLEAASMLINDEIEASKTNDFYLYQKLSTKCALLCLAAARFLKVEQCEYLNKWDKWRFSLYDEEKKFLSSDDSIILKNRSHIIYTLKHLKPYLFSKDADCYFADIVRPTKTQPTTERNSVFENDIINVIINFLHIKESFQKKAKKDILRLSKAYGQNTVELIRLKTDIYNQIYDISWYNDFLGFFKHKEGVCKSHYSKKYCCGIFTMVDNKKKFYNYLVVDDFEGTKKQLNMQDILMANNIQLHILGNAYTNHYVNIFDIHNTVSETFPKFYYELKETLNNYEKDEEVVEKRISSIGGGRKILLF